MTDLTPSEAPHLKAAMLRDRDRAVQRMDTRAVHEIEADLRAVTNAILSQGAS